jgi:xanthine dehydrogenase YagT iron-sulfur-binding subunit
LFALEVWPVIANWPSSRNTKPWSGLGLQFRLPTGVLDAQAKQLQCTSTILICSTGGSMRDDPQSSPSNPTRRTFLSATGGTAAAALLGQCAPALPNSTAEQSGSPAAGAGDGPNIEGSVAITLRINGKNLQLRVDPRTTLLDCLRETVALTGTKKGCDHGQCGACTVHVNGRRVNSCLSLALMHGGEEITTIEGLGAPDALHPMQAAFVACDGYQCGYCTSGQIMSAVALLKEPCGPDDAAVKELMSGNICRCGAYANIVAAIQQVRRNS